MKLFAYLNLSEFSICITLVGVFCVENLVFYLSQKSHEALLITVCTIESTESMQPEKTTGTIKQQLAAIAPTLEQLTKQKNERKREFVNIQSQIDQICGEIAGTIEVGEQVATPQVNEDDLTLERLEDFRSQLQELEKEKVLFYLLPFYWF
jgi:hypothetical protein